MPLQEVFLAKYYLVITVVSLPNFMNTVLKKIHAVGVDT